MPGNGLDGKNSGRLSAEGIEERSIWDEIDVVQEMAAEEMDGGTVVPSEAWSWTWRLDWTQTGPRLDRTGLGDGVGSGSGYGFCPERLDLAQDE